MGTSQIVTQIAATVGYDGTGAGNFTSVRHTPVANNSIVVNIFVGYKHNTYSLQFEDAAKVSKY